MKNAILSQAVLLFTLLGASTSCSPSHRSAETPPSTSSRELAAPGRVLFLITEASEQRLRNDKRRKTGYFLSEFYLPVRALKNAGYEPVFATRTGGVPAIDPESLQLKYWDSQQERDAALDYVRKEPRLKEPLSLDAVLGDTSDFQGLVVPGGQGVMIDLIEDPRVAQMLLDWSEQERAIGLICHAPALLLQLPKGGHFLQGRKVTSVTGLEEFYIETFVMGGKAQKRRIGRSLAQRGFDHDSAFPKANHAVRDCGLVTSQNPYSGEAFNEAFLEALTAVRSGSPCGP